MTLSRRKRAIRYTCSQSFLELDIAIGTEPALESFEDSELVAAFDGVEKWKPELLPVGLVELSQPGIFVGGESIESRACLFDGGTGTDFRACSEIGMRAKQGQLLFDGGGFHFGVHRREPGGRETRRAGGATRAQRPMANARTPSRWFR